ncbi:MAG TPA: hypothetical protein VHB79_15905 [Polyangiaceae bacterium]|nr:hypothetical protein [Polyangiaceae bacterium]
MRRPSFKTLLAFGAVAFTAGALPSCATNDSMMFIIGVAVRKAGSCTVSASLDSPILAKGTLDRALATDYVAGLLVGNQVTQRGSRDRIRTETSRITLKGAEVHLESTQGAELTPAFSSVGTGFVDASEGTDAALSAMFATLIPGSVSGKLPLGTLVAKVRVFGTTLGGEDIESAELGFPIEVCDGCLVSYSAADRDLTSDSPDYQCKVATDMAGAADTDLPCSLGIDIPAPCTVCSGVYKVCQSPTFNCYYTDSACK